MARKIRKDILVGTLEKRFKLAPGTITNPDGSDARSDKKLDTLQKEAAAAAKKPVKRTPKATAAVKKPIKATAVKPKTATVPKKRPRIDPTLITSADQKAASKRTVKSHPKTASLVKKVRAAMKTTTKK